jgi:hypothetical protein
MSTKAPEIIIDTNLSFGWGRAFLRAMSEETLPPLMISVTGFMDSVPSENDDIRRMLDHALAAQNKYDTDVSAITIFPYKHWIRSGKASRHELYDWYLKQYLPRLKARDINNRYGTYFERMIAFQGSRKKNNGFELHTKNQLEQIIDDWNRPRPHPKRPRQSALQAACLDPAKDLTGQSVRGFPCLQQVSFNYDDEGGLAVNAYYPSQYIFDRAYGNYLGLSQLGHFMAHELGLTMVRLNCFVARPELGGIQSKAALKPLVECIRQFLPQQHPVEEVQAANKTIQGVLWRSGAARN